MSAARVQVNFGVLGVILLLSACVPNCVHAQNGTYVITGSGNGGRQNGNGPGQAYPKEMLVTASSGGSVNGQIHGPAAGNGNNGQGQGSQPQVPLEPVQGPQPRLLKRCSSVLIGKVDKVSTEYVWELKGFLEFMDYLKDFDPTFELNSEKVNFTTMPELGGIWNFRIFKEVPPVPTPQQQSALNRKNAGNSGSGSTGTGAGNNTSGAISPSLAGYGFNGHASSTATDTDTPEMSIQAIHNWFEIITDSNPPEKRGINYKCVLEIKHKNRTVLQEAKTTIADIQFKFISNGRYKHQYVYTFKWRNIQTVLGNLATSGPTGSMDVVFHFTMIAHLPSENTILSTSCDPFS